MATAALLLLVGLATAQFATAQKPPAWQCAQVRDYYAKETTECATADCNAAQRNIGGEVLVLDTDSYGYTNCQGCNPANPASCCQRCKDTDGCNGWTVCTLPGGCGSGCKKYLESFGPNVRASDNGGKTFGNFKNCDGDKWPANMCTLKFVKDTKNIVVTSSNAKDGWVSGVVPKVQADPRCPPLMSAKTCKMCLATKNVAKCVECATKNKGDQQCATCANLGSASIDLCLKCVAAGRDSYGCSTCLDADCGFKPSDCINTPREKRQNSAAVEACLACMTTVAAAKKEDPLKSEFSGQCGGTCFSDTFPVAVAKKADCVKCIANLKAVADSFLGCTKKFETPQ